MFVSDPFFSKIKLADFLDAEQSLKYQEKTKQKQVKLVEIGIAALLHSSPPSHLLCIRFCIYLRPH